MEKKFENYKINENFNKKNNMISISVKINEKKRNTTYIPTTLEYNEREKIKQLFGELAKQYKMLITNDVIINLDYSVFNNISSTWMSMYGYYVNENRFVIFS